MKELKNIDRVFQENFKDLEVDPAKHVWHKIENHLQGKPKKKVLPLWQKMSGVAVAVLLFFSVGMNYFKTGRKFQFDINDFSIPDFSSAAADRDTSTILTPVFNSKNQKQEKKSVAVVSKNNKFTGKTEILDKLPITEDGNNKTFVAVDIKEHRSDQNQQSGLFKRSMTEAYTSQIAEVTKKEIKEKKWSIGPTISPVYMNSLQKGSPISEDLKNNTTVADEALSYGIKLDYKITDKLKIQTGINRVELAYNTKNVNAVVSSSKSINHNIDTKYGGIHLSSVPRQDFTEIASENLNKSGVRGDLNQSFDYLEIPMEMKYNLYDSKVGLNIVGGFSTFILTNNRVSMILTDQIYNLGQANNLNTINFSGNLGFDLDYKISKDWYFNVSPMFKYQFNTFSENAGNFKPYYFGVYSGINFRF